MAKNNSKSIRLSDEVLTYIENYEGSGFNEKFENIIIYSMKTEKERKSRIADLDKTIQKQKTECNALISKYRNLNSFLFNVLDLERRLSILQKELDSIVPQK